MGSRSHRTRLSEWADLVGASLPDSVGDDEERRRVEDSTDRAPGDGDHRRPN